MYPIAWSTLLELIRNRILSLIAFLSGTLVASTWLLASLSVGAKDRLVVDFGLSIVELSGLIVLLFVGSQILVKEIEGRTIWLILTKPVSRAAFLFGKILGFSAILAGVVGFSALVLALLLAFQAPQFLGWFFVLAVLGTYCKLLILFAILIAFSTFVSSGVALAASLAIYIGAHAVPQILDFAHIGDNPVFVLVAQTLWVILPNFSALNFRDFIHHTELFRAIPILTALGGGIAYFAAMLALGAILFNRRTFDRE